jgi:hypothetical protein
MKESAFGKKEVKTFIKPRPHERISSCASSERTESVISSERTESIPNTNKLNRYKVSYIKEEIITAHSYSTSQSAMDYNRLKITFKTDGQNSCIRDGVSKVEKLS